MYLFCDFRIASSIGPGALLKKKSDINIFHVNIRVSQERVMEYDSKTPNERVRIKVARYGGIFSSSLCVKGG